MTSIYLWIARRQYAVCQYFYEITKSPYWLDAKNNAFTEMSWWEGEAHRETFNKNY